MKRLIILTIICILIFIFTGCSSAQTVNVDNTTEYSTQEEPVLSTEEPFLHDRIPMVMVDGIIYYDTGKESTVNGRCGVMDGAITSTVDQTKLPSENNQSNFGSGYEYQYGSGNTIEIFMNGAWYVFASGDSNDSQIQYGEVWYPTADLSEETIEWLYWFNTLPSNDQLAISYIPADLLTLMGLSHPQADETANP